MFRFETPWALLSLLLPLLYFGWQRWRKRKRAAVGFSSLSNAHRVARSWRLRFAWLPSALRLLAWLLLGLALARPQAGREQIHDASQGIAIQMVLDRSTSMTQEMEYDNQRMNRLQAVKKVFASFVFGDKDKKLPGRPNDLIGVITFARYPDTICPLTLGHAALRPFLESIQIVNLRSEDGTNIGDALALAAARLQTAEETLARQNRKDADAYKIKSKVIILLTDGENNCGKRSIAEAAELAAKWNIKVYAIGVSGGTGANVINTLLGQFRVAANSAPFDTRPLQELADKTGGLFRLATDSESLVAIYREIDQLERSEVESIRFVDYKELFLPFAAAALVLLVLQQLLTATVFRRIP
ncbi:MAG: VWA domain-containing protein [Lentisphaerae bacterium]|jgi:Ca-activated chloride channel family protein|nr:VWA domain-containing protein [Lentisphaerota bacterium]